jgi:hypothetical protein
LPNQGKGTADRIRGELQSAKVPLRSESSDIPVSQELDFQTLVNKMKADKPAVMRRHQQLLESRYDLSNRPAKGVTSTRGKPACA